VPKDKDQSNEELKSFTVGSAPSGAAKSKSAPKAAGGKSSKAVKVEIRESVFPILTSFRRGGGKDAKVFQAEMQRVLLAASEVAKEGSEKEKKDAEQVQKAYALSLAILENSKIIR
jgi:hypothetical protein